MEIVNAALEELKEINEAYDIPVDTISKLQNEIVSAKVCTPIIGKFSSGKSALINTLLHYTKKILRENITPETAVPTEVIYTRFEDQVKIIRNDGSYKMLTVDEFRTFESDVKTVEKIQLQLRNSFLEKIPDVLLVDMPGFESGYERHDTIIDNYLPQSLAYIVAIPADDMIIRSSVGDILKELSLYEKPLCVVITKYDKRNDDFDQSLERMKQSLKRYVSNETIRYCMTSSFSGDAEELEEFLVEIQNKSEEILTSKYKKLSIPIIEKTQNYLLNLLNGSELSETELNEKEENIKRKMSSLETNFCKEQEDFDTEVNNCIDIIKADVKKSLDDAEPTLIAMLLNKQDIKEYINSIIKNAVIESIHKRFVPMVEKYLKKVENIISSDSLDDAFIVSTLDMEKINNGLTEMETVFVTGLTIFNPLIGIIACIIYGIFGKKKREEENKNTIKQKLRSEVFPQILREVGTNIEMAIIKHIKLVNKSIEEEFASQKDTLEKAMSNLKQQMNDEKSKKENLLMNVRNDLEIIERIKNGLQ